MFSRGDSQVGLLHIGSIESEPAILKSGGEWRDERLPVLCVNNTAYVFFFSDLHAVPQYRSVFFFSININIYI